MEQKDRRKEKEKEFHDLLRGDLQDNPHYTSNKKFYAITQSNRDFVKNWLLQRCRGRRVLDYCCGNGDFTIWLAENGAEAYGIDISPVSIENGNRNAILWSLVQLGRLPCDVVHLGSMPGVDVWTDALVACP